MAALFLCAPLIRGQYGDPQVLARVRIPGLSESSGLVASRAYPDIYWTHNDSGAGPWLFAFDRKGRSAGRWRVRGAGAVDWEDIAIGPAPDGRWFLYIGDIGDNRRARPYVTVYRVPEPEIGNGRITQTARAVRFRYPDGPHDAECLLVHPGTGDLFIVTKAHFGDGETRVYRGRFAPGSGLVPLRRIGSVELPDRGIFGRLAGVTGGDISPDGKRVVLCDYFGAAESAFDPKWKTNVWAEVEFGRREQGEAVCYRADGKALISGSEGVEFPLVEVESLP